MEFTSPIKRWSGRVTLPDYLTWKQLIRWQNAVAPNGDNTPLTPEQATSQLYDKLLPLACEVVEEWGIVGLPDRVTSDNFPANVFLANWLIECVTRVFVETSQQDPNS